MSYNGMVNFGLLGDYDLMYDLDEVTEDFNDSLAELAKAAGVRLKGRGRPRRFGRTATAKAGAGAAGEGDDTVS
jgi:hypothetical protein